MFALPRYAMLLTLGALSLAAIGQNVYYWTQLPERVATHFGADGQPNAWMDRTSATFLMLTVQLGLPWFLVGIGRLTRSIPAALVNIPNREYWLKGDRRDASLAFVQHFVTVIAVASSLFMIAINHLTFVANMRSEGLNLQAMILLLVLYLIGVAVMVASMWKRFRIPATGH